GHRDVDHQGDQGRALHDPGHLRVRQQVLSGSGGDGRATATPSSAVPLRLPRRRTRAALALLALLFAVDLTRPPARQWSAIAEIFAIDVSRAHVAPWGAAAGVRCRFEPSCSRYARGAVEKSGGLVGPLRAAWRVLRCGPWTKAGTVDPP